MQGLWLQDGKVFFRRDIPDAKPESHEVLIKVLCAGICATDLELVRGYYPYSGVIGHEFVGIVVAGSSQWLGRRVVGEINAPCGHCDFCRQGLDRHCRERTVLGIVKRHGALAEYLVLPLANLHWLPQSLPTQRAVFVEPLAAALQIQEQVPISAKQRVLVVGDGRLGLLVAQSLALTKCRVLLAGHYLSKLEIAANRGVEVILAEKLDEGDFDVCIECTGNSVGFATALAAVRPRGTLVLKSTYSGALTLDASRLVVDEIKLIGSRCGPFSKAIALLLGNKIEVDAMIEATYPLDQALLALEHAGRKGALKVLVDVGPPTEN